MPSQIKKLGTDGTQPSVPRTASTNELYRLAAEAQGKSMEQEKNVYDFFIGLNGFLLLRTDTCIEFWDCNSKVDAIEIDDDALTEVRKVLDEQMAIYGQSVDGLPEVAAKAMRGVII